MGLEKFEYGVWGGRGLVLEADFGFSSQYGPRRREIEKKRRVWVLGFGFREVRVDSGGRGQGSGLHGALGPSADGIHTGGGGGGGWVGIS